jgi:uncharacterized protein YcbK (DUF882 family)
VSIEPVAAATARGTVAAAESPTDLVDTDQQLQHDHALVQQHRAQLLRQLALRHRRGVHAIRRRVQQMCVWCRYLRVMCVSLGAAENNVKLGLCSSYRDIAENARVGGVVASNHLVGHAIDINVIDRNGQLCNWNCLLSSSQRAAHPGVQEVIDCFNALPHPSRYGGNPSWGIIRCVRDLV